MKRIDSTTIGIQQGRRVLFSDFVNEGPMWSGEGEREVRVAIQFDTPFRDAPAVQASVGMLDMGNMANIRADLAVEGVTPNQFEVVFRTWGDTRIARVRVDWMAIGAAISADEWTL